MRRDRTSALGAAMLGLGALVFATVPADLYRFSRPVTAPEGWVRLALPDDVLDACRPGLPDLRVVREGNAEIPWALEQRIHEVSRRLELRDVERASGRETTALLDRGARPGLAAAVTLMIDGEDFLKPVVIESSDDRASWRAFASGSVFATRLARSTTLRFSPNDRRWWRLRFDDRNGDPISPRAAIVETSAGTQVAALREIPLALSVPSPDEPSWTVSAPAANLGIVALKIQAEAVAYSRHVRVVERVFFRGEVLRRVVGEGSIVRAADGSGNDVIPIGESAARSLEIEVEASDGPSLQITRVVAFAPPRAILFSAPAGAALRLLYGSTLADPPNYDLERALAGARPHETAAGSLGAPAGVAPAGFPIPPRGAAVDPAGWKRRQPIVPPSAGNVAYLDLTGAAGEGPGTPRIVDADNRQVPYVLERAEHRKKRVVPFRDMSRGTKTIVEISGLGDHGSIDTVDVSATAPSYFSRELVVAEEITDERGAAGNRILGSASWEKRPEAAAATLRVPIARPSGERIRIEIENGDNAPVVLGSTAVETSVPRLDFVFSPREELMLLSGNPDAAAPRYDLELVAARVLSEPALPAHLGTPSPAANPKSPATPPWLWIVVAVAAVLVVVVLVRTLSALRP